MKTKTISVWYGARQQGRRLDSMIDKCLAKAVEFDKQRGIDPLSIHSSTQSLMLRFPAKSRL